MATSTYYISASYIGQGLVDTNFYLFHTQCGLAANLIEYSGSTTISSASLSDGLVLELDNSISTLYLSPISNDCPLGCGYEYKITLSVPASPTPTPTSTQTPTPTVTSTPPSTPGVSPDPTPSPTTTPTPTPSFGVSPPPTPSPTATPSNTPSNTPTPSVTPSGTPTSTPTPTNTPTPTKTPTPTPTPTSSPIPCYSYTAANESNQTITITYTDCSGVLRGVPIPAGYTDFDFCAQIGTTGILEGESLGTITENGPC